MPLTDDNLESMFTFGPVGGREINELPFRILVLGDWSGTGEKPPLSSRRPIEIDRDNFDEVMRRLGTAAELPLAENGALGLRFEELDDFHPDRIFERVQIFSDLRDLRRRLKNPDTFYEAAREVRSWSASDAAAPAAAESPADESPAAESGDLLSQILTQPSGGAAVLRSRPALSKDLNNLIGDLMRPHIARVDENEQSQMLSAVDSATSELMRSVLHDHGFQTLEAAWRGLYLLVRKADTDSDLKIFILDITKDELTDGLKAAADLADSPLYKLLVRDAAETPGGEPWSAVFGNYAFLPEKDDIAGLIRVARLGQAAGAPFISHMRPEVLGVHSLFDSPDPRGWNADESTDAARLWATLRAMPEARYLGMTMPRFLARLPYGADTEPLESFLFEEFGGEPEHDKYLWGNAAFLCALVLARSFSAHGWEMGRSLIQDLDDLPLHMYKRDGETVFQPCGEVLMTDEGCEKIMNSGLMPLVSFKNTDRVRLAYVQSISDPAAGLKGRWNS
jgi:type VI secretion system protein ImpC